MTTSATETEPFELDPAAVTEPPAPEQTDHLAQCPTCAFSVRFRSLPSGNAFVLVDSQASLGIGENGLPVCPNGHGEMPLADEQLPAADAFALAQEQLTEQRAPRLPFPTAPFNYEGALHEIFEKQSEITKFEIKFNDADERRKKAKGALDEAREELSKMIDVIREREEDRLNDIARRAADVEAGHVDGTNLVRCTWEEQHQGETCPICSDDTLRFQAVAARDSVLHIDEVVELLDVQSAMAVSDALEAFGIVVPLDYLRHLSEEDRAAVKAWAEFDRTSTEAVPERPKVLGTCHVAGEVLNDNDPQLCTQCDAVLTAVPEDGSEPNYYAEGILVGVDCPGRAKTDGQHYPKRGGGRRKRQQAAE